jgi:hypothetical protein
MLCLTKRGRRMSIWRLLSERKSLRLDFSLNAISVLAMATNLDEDVRALKAEIRGAWRRLADPGLTSFDRRETRNYMKEPELALSAGLKRLADRERSRREVEVTNSARRLDFRIIQLDV